MQKKLRIGIILIFSLSLLLWGETNNLSAKPSGAIAISISLAGSAIEGQSYQIGEVVELLIQIHPFLDSKAMEIKLKLSPGLQLVSETAKWSLPVRKGELKTISVTVKIMGKGKQKLEVHGLIPLPGKKGFFTRAVFRFEPLSQKQTASPPSIKKNSDGQEIIEYRLK